MRGESEEEGRKRSVNVGRGGSRLGKREKSQKYQILGVTIPPLIIGMLAIYLIGIFFTYFKLMEKMTFTADHLLQLK